ncbi:MAG: glycosyltransferase [Erysipelotrichaceae bacterium]|nr:glycosyltransferase [Erysipelotrichaceae bacterium]
MLNDSLISIIIPVYNCQNYLKRCLDSVFLQDYSNYEIICIDDGSTDNSAQIAKEYNVRYYYQENSGQAVARNKGIELAKGEWLCFVDSDDAIQPNYLSKMYEATNNDIDIVVCRIKRINEDGSYNIDVMKKLGIINNKEALVTVNLGPTNKLIRKEVIKDSRFAGDKLRFEDVLFTTELLTNSRHINIIDDVLYDYYIRENSTMRKFDNTLNDIFIILDRLINKPFYKGYKDEIDYIVFKNGLFGHLSRIIYFDSKTINNEFEKADNYIKKNVSDYKKNKYIMSDKQPYFYVGTRLYMLGMLKVLVPPLKLIEKKINR